MDIVVLASNSRQVLMWAHIQLQSLGYWCALLWLHTLSLGIHIVVEDNGEFQSGLDRGTD